MRRYIVYSHSKGVYLGGGDWSLVDHKGKTHAPTFDGTAYITNLEGLKDTDGTYVEVHNFDPTDFTVSRENVHAAGVPGWDPFVPAQGQDVSPKVPPDKKE